MTDKTIRDTIYDSPGVPDVGGHQGNLARQGFLDDGWRRLVERRLQHDIGSVEIEWHSIVRNGAPREQDRPWNVSADDLE